MADTQRKERFGLGGLFHSPSTQELSLRGFFFSDRKIAAVGLRTGAGAWIAPSRERIRRNDVVKAFPQCQNPLCGLEFSIPGVADPAELQPLSFVARRADKSEYVIRIESPVTVVEVDGSIDHVSANIVSHHIRISGTLPNNGAAQLQSLRLGGFMLMDLASKADRASRRFTAEASLRTPVRQPNSETAKAELYQMTPRPGQVLEAVFRPTKGNHLINIRRELTGAEVQTAVGVLSKARVSGANGLVEFSGGFFGDFPAGRVQLEANGKTLPRNARLDPHYEGFPKALPGVMDSAFSGWRWCGEAPATELTSARLVVRLQNGSHEVAVIDCVLEPDLIEFTNEPLEPSFFISPFQEQFDALLAAAQPSDMPIVAMVFPGDLFATFAGGPTRVLEMSRYLHSMGFAIGLIDMPLSFEETSEIPEAFREFIAWRAPLPKKNLQDLAHLGLDYLQSETGREPLQRALEAALDQVDKMPGEVIERRTNPAFNALAALLISKVKADFAISHFVWTAPVLELLGPETVKILDIHDIQHLRGTLHRQWTGQDDYQADEALELELWKKADYVLAIEADEKDLIIEKSGRNNVVLATHPARAVQLGRSKAKGRDLMFVGNAYPPNKLALERFLREGWPKLHKAHPKAKMLIVGSVGNDLQTDAAGVEILGVVPDLAEIYKRAALVINPVEYGTGLNIKTIEALAYGRCLVTTPHGARGLREAGADLPIVAFEDLADEAARLLSDNKARWLYEAEAERLAGTILSPDYVFRELFNTMELRLYS